MNVHLQCQLCFWVLSTVLFIFQNTTFWRLETGFCFRLLVKPTQFGPVDKATSYFRTPVPAPRWGTQAKHNTNHLRELRQNIEIKISTHEQIKREGAAQLRSVNVQ
jgi:hypothetical protein